QSRSVISRNATRGNTAALLIKTSMGPSPSRTAATIDCTCSYLARVCLDQDRTTSAGAYLISNTLGCAKVIEPVDRDVGASGGKLQRHGSTDPLLGPCHQNHLSSELHVQPPRFDARADDPHATG